MMTGDLSTLVSAWGAAGMWGGVRTSHLGLEILFLLGLRVDGLAVSTLLIHASMVLLVALFALYTRPSLCR